MQLDYTETLTAFENINAHSNQCLKTYSCGKTILSGEHAVVYGAHALAIPVPSKVINLEVIFNHIKPFDDSEDRLTQSLHSLLQNAFKVLNIDIDAKSYKPVANCEIPIAAGLGASAALCVSVAKIAFEYAKQTPSPDEIARLANELEKTFHGNPSGLDTMVVSHAKPVLFKKNTNAKIWGISSDLNFVLIDSLQRSSTKTMVEHTKSRFLSPSSDKLIQQFDEISLELANAINSFDNCDQVADLILKNQILLDSLEISTTKLDELMDLANKCGAKASKITGAGGGGFILSLVENKNLKTFIKKIYDKISADRLVLINKG